MRPFLSCLKYKILFLILAVGLLGWNCTRSAEEATQDSAITSASEHIEHPEWSKSANIYEVNIRQYTPEGTFKAFQKELPRLKNMGVDILWLMPIHPIGEKRRKGELGSYYSIKDYTAVNPNFGTRQDFFDLVRAIHANDMKVFLDMVPNHTAWDHPWVTEHPEYYMKDSLGNITYEADWTDIAQLNYENRALWDDMIEKLKYWVEEANIDGYRVDHAGHDIPLEFWKKAIPEVNNVKQDFFWLAEWNTPEMHPWFDATYTWEYFHLTTEIAKGEASLDQLTEYMARQDSLYPGHAYRLYFTTNHDENSWNGTDEELFGDNFENFAVMASTIDGMPLIYSGQETGLEQRLEFFKKDTIDWDGYEYEDFYRTLFELKDRNEALWNGQHGGHFQHVQTSPSESIYAYKRVKGDSEVLVVLNLTGQEQQVALQDIRPTEYSDVFSGETLTVGKQQVAIPAHSHLVLEK
ncbi:alpha-amylase family glycosyl hydrolase [Aliifodinibius sp. S!AR15-10]|uniref:alpha-amylase family glycosyl hydrolase n=1 Tax=Aliifodinibius sp. S!AR15-10 TaxID=2950437 RepID=UPI00286357B4|nr:alpha-amylase family glycosyl hydrolase [Aliifodinibius sp. S!AR15-10]MDR8390318.1 alpha-amylase family glycosyl hydrolase [Aliifodinibius sp. S!AR15-10]